MVGFRRSVLWKRLIENISAICWAVSEIQGSFYDIQYYSTTTRIIAESVVITVGSSRRRRSKTSANSEVVTIVVTSYFSICALGVNGRLPPTWSVGMTYMERGKEPFRQWTTWQSGWSDSVSREEARLPDTIACFKYQSKSYRRMVETRCMWRWRIELERCDSSGQCQNILENVHVATIRSCTNSYDCHGDGFSMSTTSRIHGWSSLEWKWSLPSQDPLANPHE